MTDPKTQSPLDRATCVLRDMGPPAVEKEPKFVKADIEHPFGPGYGRLPEWVCAR